MKIGVIIFTNMTRLRGDAIHVSNLLNSFKKQGLEFEIFQSLAETKQLKNKTLNILKKILLRLKLLLLITIKKKGFRGFYLRDWLFAYFLSYFNIKYYFEVNGLFVYEGLIRYYAASGSFNEKMLIHIEKRVTVKANKIVCVSKGMKDYLIKRHKATSNKILVVSNAANLEVYNPNIKKIQILFENKTFIVGWMGSLDAYHGIADLIEIAELLLKNKNHEIIFMIISGGKEIEKIIKSIKNKGLEKYFKFLGSKNWKEVPSYMINASVCLSLDKRSKENLEYRNIIGVTTIKVYEYLALGKPIITYDLGDAKNFFENQKIGWVCKPEIKDLYQKLVGVSKKPKEIKEYSIRALLLAKEKYNWDYIAKSIINFIEHA